MANLLYFVLIYFCIHTAVYSQGIDSLLLRANQLEQEPIDSNLSKVYYDLGRMTYISDKDTSLYFLNKSKEIAQGVNFAPGIQKSAYLLSTVYKKRLQYEAALENLEICIQALPSAKKRHIRCLKMAGDVHRYLNKFNVAEKYYHQADSLGQIARDTAFLGTLYNSQAIYAEQIQQFDESITFYLKSAEIDKIKKKYNDYVITLGNIIGLHLRFKEAEKAAFYLAEAQKYSAYIDEQQTTLLAFREAQIYYLQNDYEPALRSFQIAIDLANKNDDLYLKPSINLDYATCYVKMGNNSKALNLIKIGFPFAKSPTQILSYQTLFAEILVNLGRCQEAKEWIQKSEIGLEDIKDFSTKSSFYAVKAKFQYCIGNIDKGNKANDISFLYVDSSYYERKELEAKKIEKAYQTQIKEDSIKILELNNNKQSVALRNQRMGMFGFLIISLLAGGLALYYRRYTQAEKQINSLLNKEKEELETERDELVFKNKELKIINQNLKNKVNKAPTVVTEDKSSSTKVKFKSADKVYLLEPQQVLYLQAEAEGSRIYQNDGTSKWTDTSLKELRSNLHKKTFVKIFRNTIVNIEHVGWVNTTSLKLKNGKELRISRTYKQDIKDAVSFN
jgi:tetratricopeptide (TPR) repeat protein